MMSLAALVLSVQLYGGGPVVRFRVPSCEPALTTWLLEAEVWAANSNIPFTGAAGCGLDPAPPPAGYSLVELPERPGRLYLVPDSNTANYREPLPVIR
ncbi:MAG TPA: hypothetical protein VFA39_18930 [Steroidobacteraceae bacterium]|nr:hypothetical protein [Steroidobacteraceae bacterium]